jgi:hypothetical protein
MTHDVNCSPEAQDIKYAINESQMIAHYTRSCSHRLENIVRLTVRGCSMESLEKTGDVILPVSAIIFTYITSGKNIFLLMALDNIL